MKQDKVNTIHDFFFLCSYKNSMLVFYETLKERTPGVKVRM